MKRCWPLVLIIAALAAPPNLAQAPESSLPIEIAIPVAPAPVRGGGASHLYYELHLTNFRAVPLELTRIEVHSSDGNRRLESYSDKAIIDRLFRPGLPPDLPDKRVLAGGQRAIVMLHLQFDGNRPVPTQLWHRLTFTVVSADGSRREESIDAGRVAVSTQRTLVIAPPLRGGDWVALNGPSNNSVHRRALLVVNGMPRIAQRFAIDWVKLGPGGRLTHDDRSRNENWNGYGEEVLAVADGTVIATKDGIPDNVPLTAERAVPITLETITGNVVVVDIGNGRYATFGHLAPKSVRVAVGAKVRRGQVLGLLGNSGNSDAPHLHFHITDGPSPLGSEGVPYIFESMQSRGTVPLLEKLLSDDAWIPQSGTVVRTREIPLDNAVIRFP